MHAWKCKIKDQYELYQFNVERTNSIIHLIKPKIMKKLLISLVFVTICNLIANCQNSNNIQAMIAEYKENDTLTIDDFLTLKEMDLNDSDYKITSFALILVDSGFVKEIKSNSNLITDQMKDALLNFNDKSKEVTKIYFKNITIQSPQNQELKIKSLVYILKLK